MSEAETKRVIFYYPQEGRDTESANKFGQSLYLFETYAEAGTPFRTDATIKKLKDRIRVINFDPAEDFVVMTGGQLHIALLVACLASQFKVIKCLFFDSKSNEYVVRILRV